LPRRVPPRAKSSVAASSYFMPRIAPRLAPEISLLAMIAEPAPTTTETQMPIGASRTTLPSTTTSRSEAP
jgi:hypothetical protein